MQFTKYGDMLSVQRWIIVDVKTKAPVQQWTHPRIKTASGKAARMAVSTQNGGKMCTSSTGETWLTEPEAAGICGGLKSDARPAFVHRSEDSAAFLDFDFKPHPNGNTREAFEAWFGGIMDGLRANHPGLPVLRSLSGNYHLIVNLTEDDKAMPWPKVVLDCACGIEGCEQGGKMEHWIGSKSRYRIQPQPLPDEIAAMDIPTITRAEFAALPEFAEAFAKAERQATLLDELPPDPIFMMSMMGASIRILDYIKANGLQHANLRPPETGYWFATDEGPWTEFGDDIQSLTLHRRAGERAMAELSERGITPKVLGDFAAYLGKHMQPRSLHAIRATLLSVLQDAPIAQLYAPRRMNRADFNRRGERYLLVGEGAVDLLGGARPLSAREITTALITEDAPRLTNQDESPYTESERAFARDICLRFLSGWGDDKLALILHHARWHKGGIFIVGERDTGKSLLFQQLEALGLAALFPWSDENAPRIGRRQDKFGLYKEARTRVRLTVFDELTGIRDLDDVENVAGENPPDSALMKEEQGALAVTYQRKGEQLVRRRVTSGLGFLANAAPALPSRSDVYAKTDTHFMYAAKAVPEIAGLDKGYAADVLLSPPALNEVARAVLRILPEVASNRRAPLTLDMQQDDIEIANRCQQAWDKWQAQRKGKK